MSHSNNFQSADAGVPDEVVFLSRHGDQFTAVLNSCRGRQPVHLCEEQAAGIVEAGQQWAIRQAGLVHDHWAIEYAAGNRLMVEGGVKMKKQIPLAREIMPEVIRLLQDNTGRFTVTLAYGPGDVTVPVTEIQAQTLIETATQRKQIAQRWSAFGKRSIYFQPSNELTAVINEEGDPDTLLSLAPCVRDRKYWFGWVAGDGAKFWFVPSNIAQSVLDSAQARDVDTQKGKVRKRHHYLFEQPNRLVDCLRAAVTCRILKAGTCTTYVDNYTNLPLDERVIRAATYYEKERGHRPTTLIFHSDSGVENQEMFGMRVLSSPNVLRPPHIEIGIEIELEAS